MPLYVSKLLLENKLSIYCQQWLSTFNKLNDTVGSGSIQHISESSPFTKIQPLKVFYPKKFVTQVAISIELRYLHQNLTYKLKKKYSFEDS